MKRRICVIAAAMAVCVSACLAATEPWKSKDYEKWSSKEVERILNDSPWAKLISAPRSPYLNGDSPETGASARIGGSTDNAGSALPDGSGTRMKNGFILRWNSSLTIRRALYRQAVLKGSDPAAASQAYLDERPDDLDLVMINAAESLLPPNDAPTLMDDAYIEFQPSKIRVSPSAASVSEMVDARGHRGYVFSFPKKSQDGKSIIPDGTMNIVFRMHIGPVILITAFKPAEMIGADGPDLL
jgi:hypothetical protein